MKISFGHIKFNFGNLKLTAVQKYWNSFYENCIRAEFNFDTSGLQRCKNIETLVLRIYFNNLKLLFQSLSKLIQSSR